MSELYDILKASNFSSSGGGDIDTSAYATALLMAINSDTYVLSSSLKNENGETLGTPQTIDLPLETMVVGGSYDDTTKKVILTLKNGNTVDFSVADLVEGLQSEITSSNKLDSDLVDDTNQNHKFVTSAEKTKIAKALTEEVYNAGKTTPKGTQYTIFGTTYTVGDNAEVFNKYSNNKAIGNYSHAEGDGTTASGNNSHAEGGGTTASDINSHAEGGGTTASGNNSHAEGGGTTASGDFSHAEGVATTASGNNSHAEGDGTTASGDNSHAEGGSTTASGDYSHAEGGGTTASGNNSHAEGGGTKASGMYSHAEGLRTTASDNNSHAEGGDTTARGMHSHAEGLGTTASGDNSHAEGLGTTASGNNSHAEGGGTTASDNNSHAEGGGTTASGNNSHAEGLGTTASSSFQHVQGKYNVEDSNSKYAFIIGNGTSNSARSNAFAVDWDGKIYVNNSATGINVSQLQPVISSSNKLSADLVDDSDSPNKFVTSDEKTKISNNNNALVELIDSGQKNLVDAQNPSGQQRVTIVNSANGGVVISCNNATWATTAYHVYVTPNEDYKLILYVDNADVSNVTFRCFTSAVDDSDTELEVLPRTEQITETGVYTLDISTQYNRIKFSPNINNSATAGSGSATIRMMLCSKAAWDISQKYVPYRPSYDELVARITALENA